MSIPRVQGSAWLHSRTPLFLASCVFSAPARKGHLLPTTCSLALTPGFSVTCHSPSQCLFCCSFCTHPSPCVPSCSTEDHFRKAKAISSGQAGQAGQALAVLLGLLGLLWECANVSFAKQSLRSNSALKKRDGLIDCLSNQYLTRTNRNKRTNWPSM